VTGRSSRALTFRRCYAESKPAYSALGSWGSAPVVSLHYPGHRPRCPEHHLRGRPLSTRISCATPNLYLKHADITVAQRYKRRQMKHLKQASETLAKTSEKHLKAIKNICNIQMKHSQTYVRNVLKYLKHMLVTCMYIQHLDLLLQQLYKTLATFVWNK
jgi:hypothetical protein